MFKSTFYTLILAVALVVKNPPANAGDIRDMGSIPGLERFLEEGNGNPLQYSCLENPMDGGAWKAAVHEVAKSQTRLKRLGSSSIESVNRYLLCNHVYGMWSGKEPACQCRRHKRHGFDPWVGKIPWRRAWQHTPVFWPGESHRQRSLVRCSQWGHKELDTTE